MSLLDNEVSSFFSASLYVSGILLITYAFHNFVIYVNKSYKSAVDLSLTDELTGLPNRRHLNLQIIALEKEVAVIGILDVDYFKQINDTYGHEMGDKVLREIGLILHRFIDDNIFIARSGGEEFSIIITNHHSADDIIREIKQRISKENTRHVNVTVSIGVANKQAHHSPSVALTAADEALYKAKRAGRDQIVYASYSLQRPVTAEYISR